MFRSLRRHGLTVAVSVVTAGVVAGPPVSAHITQNPGHNWNTHYRPLADQRYWKLSGNAITAGRFLGTINNQALNFRVNSARAFRLEPNATSPNVIGGFSGNNVTPGVAGATIGGGGQSGERNRVTDSHGTVGGGANNLAGDDSGRTDSAPSATVGGGTGNTASDWSATVGGGRNNTASAFGATVGGGGHNTASFSEDTVGGGSLNTADGGSATVGGGSNNNAIGGVATVGGGSNNTASRIWTTVAGGDGNAAAAGYATVGGGTTNTASGEASTIPGGSNNLASANYSFAAGRKAKADDIGAFVWGDSQDADIFSPGVNTFSVRALGGIWLGTGAAPASMTAGRFMDTSTGGYLSTAGVWTDASSRILKENFHPVDPADILDRVTALPVTVWNYRGQDPSVRHIGPVAEDFHSVFGVGDDSKHIASLDTGGVALAAIQGLNQKVEQLGGGTAAGTMPWMPWAAALVGFALCLGLMTRRGLVPDGGGPPSS
jgi:hypothetical protein